MVIESHELRLRTSARTDVVDITDEVQTRLGESEVSNGVAVVFVPGSTGAVTTIEYEPGVLSDLVRAIERLAPEGLDYDHDRRWGDGNGYAHVRAAMLGPSLSIPLANGRLVLGTWQQIVLLDFDNRSRQRRVMIQFMGEGEPLER